MTNYKEMTNAELLAEKSYMEQLGYAGEVQLLDITEEWEARKAAKNAPMPAKTFVDHLEEELTVSVYGHRKHKKVINKYGSADLIDVPTHLKEFTYRVEGVYVYGVFDPNTCELKKVTCPSKRKDNKHYKKCLERDYEYIVELWQERNQ